jgi:[ribosomal protein S5]-alanine N-acetyltransferase
MKSLPQLNTDRLVLRAFERADASAVERLAGAWEVAETTLTIPHPYPIGGAEGWIGAHTEQWDAGNQLVLAVCERHEPESIIGAISLALTTEHARGELGYWISVERWGRGFATEAARAVVTYGFTDLALHRIQARHFVRNPASGRVMQKLGMQFEGINRDAYRRWDRFEDVAVYAILATEWRQ